MVSRTLHEIDMMSSYLKAKHSLSIIVNRVVESVTQSKDRTHQIDVIKMNLMFFRIFVIPILIIPLVTKINMSELVSLTYYSTVNVHQIILLVL
jgi:hypothetical protein